ncbi:MAG: GDP-mannose 4,6-dehydratase [Thermoleophilaceae bacterium]|nr:GDP-mannose 4,6-dehydratase [Thermoleophilaceae bacterium]
MLALVTGGAGFIGSNLVDALLARGDDVVVIDDLSSGFRENLEGAASAELLISDIRDGEAVAAITDRVRPDVIIHLAAQMDVRRSIAEPGLDLATNAGGTLNMLAAARDAGVRRFVNVSTGGAIYGEAQVMPAPEDHPTVPDAPYGVSKRAAELYCGVHSRLYGTSTVSLRLGNVYGPRQNPRSEAGVIAIFCGCLVRGETARIFGDGGQTRDFVFVEDIVAALLAAAEGEQTGAFNIGTGAATSMVELAAQLDRLAEGEGGFKPVHEAERLGEIRQIALDATRAADELGWSSRVELASGLERTLAWVRAHPERA